MTVRIQNNTFKEGKGVRLGVLVEGAGVAYVT